MKFSIHLCLLIAAAAIFSLPALAQDRGGVKGKVRTSRDVGLSGVKVTVSQNDAEIKSSVTNRSGDFFIDGLKTGKYTFSFSKTGFTTGSLNNVEIKKDKVRDLGSRLVLDVDEGTLVFIRGSVFSESGWSIFGAKVDIASVEADGSLKKLGSGFSNDSGEFAFRFSNKPATYRVTATYKGVTGSRDVTVDSAAIYRLAITLAVEKAKEKEKDDN